MPVNREDPSALSARRVRGVSWTLIAAASSAAGVLVALVTFHGVRATTVASSSVALNEALARGAMAAIPLGVALYACRQRAHARFGALLLGVSGVWLLAMLSSSSSPLVHSVGRVSGWTAVLALACVTLTYPTGRLATRADRALAIACASIVAVLYLPTALLVRGYQTPSPFDTCSSRCPHNVFMITSHEPSWIGGFVSPLRDLLVAVVVLLVAVRLGQKIRGSNTLVRRTLVWVLAASIAWLTLMAFGLVARRVAPHSVTARAGMWLFALAVPVVAVAFLVGIARWRVFVNGATQRASAKLRRLPRPEHVRDVLAEAFEDPDLKLGHWLGNGWSWVTAGGATLEMPATDPGRWLTEIRDEDRHVAAIEHDATLRDEPAFIEPAGSFARIAFEGERLVERTAGMLREVTDSRARLIAAADGERRRIARDLHDGAQQRLVALRIELELAAAEAEHDSAEQAATLREFGVEIAATLEDFRSMTSGIYPAILSDYGLAEAIHAAALRAPIHTTVDTARLSEYPAEIATAVYFCCVEALQNVAKHATGATEAHIVLAETESTLHFSISDNGPGFNTDRTRLGAGLINMRDRLSVVGGKLTVKSTPGHGTLISGRIPLTATTPAPTAPHDGPARRAPLPHLRRGHAR